MLFKNQPVVPWRSQPCSSCKHQAESRRYGSACCSELILISINFCQTLLSLECKKSVLLSPVVTKVLSECNGRELMCLRTPEATAGRGDVTAWS